ncbi:MAG TPA: hypothetical protein G4O01_04015 [Dehalococcoidia bacterium]|nr:hypothetical protein [Dehalococcoidia bacterium]
MAKEEQKIVRQLGESRIIVADSAAAMDESNCNDILVVGSHCGINVGELALHNGIRGLIGNDAGLGKNEAGIAGLKLLEKHGIPAAAVACMSAKIGFGMSTYEQGRISVANEVARKLGVSAGMSAKEAADKMLESLLPRTK